MSQTLELIIKARDEASRQIGAVSTKLGELKDYLAIGAGIVGGSVLAVKAVQRAYEDLIVPVMDYNREVLRMAEATGMKLEEAGRITEVAQDAGIELPALATALEMATKNGFDPTLESIAALADEVAGMNDPSERAEYLSKLLGRNWAVLLPLLQDGGPAFLALAAAVNEGLLPTEQFADDTEELRARVDALNESMDVASLKILEGLIPAFMEGADWAAKFLTQLGLVESSVYGQQYGSRGGRGLGPAPVVDPYKGYHGPRALGGEVGTGGDAYMVGEHGAERFTPSVPGTISPTRDQLASSIDRMVKTLPTILIDAIERAK